MPGEESIVADIGSNMFKLLRGNATGQGGRQPDQKAKAREARAVMKGMLPGFTPDTCQGSSLAQLYKP